MGKIFYIMGKSSTGKDTIFSCLKERFPKLKSIVLYTTRPMREGEQEGREYFFVGEEQVTWFEEQGRLIELRSYQTVHGVWKYFTVDDGQFKLQEENYLIIGTLESYDQLCAHFGAKTMIPIYIEVESGERLSRALKREQEQPEPKYAELCRRYLADEEDFAEGKLQRSGIEKRFKNYELEACLDEISLYINQHL